MRSPSTLCTLSKQTSALSKHNTFLKPCCHFFTRHIARKRQAEQKSFSSAIHPQIPDERLPNSQDSHQQPASYPKMSTLSDPTAEEAVTLFENLEGKFPTKKLGTERWYLLAVSSPGRSPLFSHIFTRLNNTSRTNSYIESNVFPSMSHLIDLSYT